LARQRVGWLLFVELTWTEECDNSAGRRCEIYEARVLQFVLDDDRETVLRVQQHVVKALPLQTVLDGEQHLQEVAQRVDGRVVPAALTGHLQKLVQRLKVTNRIIMKVSGKNHQLGHRLAYLLDQVVAQCELVIADALHDRPRGRLARHQAALVQLEAGQRGAAVLSQRQRVQAVGPAVAAAVGGGVGRAVGAGGGRGCAGRVRRARGHAREIVFEAERV
jgi:hypothetical protein